MNSVWELVQTGQYQAAIQTYSRLFTETGNVFNLRNRATAFLLLKDYGSALDDYRIAIEKTETQYQASSDYIGSGLCLWCLGHADEAIATWRLGLEVPYTDAGGGVNVPSLLFYVGERLGDNSIRQEAIERLNTLMRRHERKTGRADPSKSKAMGISGIGLGAWPGPIVPFLLGIIDEAQLTALAHIPNGPLKDRRQCQVDFHVGVKALRGNDQSLFREAMVRCSLSKYGALEYEFFIANWEVDGGFYTLIHRNAGA